jgi:hypothetical protein
VPGPQDLSSEQRSTSRGTIHEVLMRWTWQSSEGCSRGGRRGKVGGEHFEGVRAMMEYADHKLARVKRIEEAWIVNWKVCGMKRLPVNSTTQGRNRQPNVLIE